MSAVTRLVSTHYQSISSRSTVVMRFDGLIYITYFTASDLTIIV